MTPAESDQLHRKFTLGDEPEEILVALDRLDEPAEAGSLSLKVELELRHAALRSLQRTMPVDTAATREIIVNRLLPLCLRDVDEKDLEPWVVIHNCRELASEWLNSLVGPEADVTLDVAVNFLITNLDSTDHYEAACWTILRIGYRTEKLMDRLWRLVESSDRMITDIALQTLASLGLAGAPRQRCLDIGLAIAHERLSPSVVAALIALPDAATIPILSKAWLGRSQTELGDVGHELLSLFTQIGSSLDDPTAIDQSCDAIAMLHANLPPRFGRWLRLAGNALPALDSPLATEMLLRLLAEETNATAYDRWLVMLRLETCFRPRQLEGLARGVAHDATVIAVLRNCVLEPGTHFGRDSMPDGQAKISALRTALLLGVSQTLDWLSEAVANEANPYRQQEILDNYAALRVAHLPEPIPRWITEEKELGREPADNADLMRRLAASRVARSAETWEAFDLLSRPGLLRDGAVMLETAEGLVAATVFLGADAEQCPRVLNRLFTAIEQPTTRPQLASACRALAAAAQRGWLADDSDRMLRALTAEPNIPLMPHDRAEIIAAVVAVVREVVPAWVYETLARWAREHDDALGERAAQALVEMGRFADHAEWLAPKLGLSPHAQAGWQWSAGMVGQFESAPFMIVQLYSQSPKLFSPALCSVFADERWFVRYDAVGAFLRSGLAYRARLNDALRDALFARVRFRQSSRQADPPLLRQAAILAPERFVRENWSAVCRDWMEDARIALADALGALPAQMLTGSPDLRRLAAAHLIELAHDGQFAVRRAAHRSLGRVLPQTLESLCSALAESPDVEKRALAAEAWAWLPTFAFSPPNESFAPTSDIGLWSPNVASWRKRLSNDVSKRVREAAREAADARNRREWARAYYLQLVTLTAPSDADLLRSWKLGSALAHTGDDETLRHLRNHLDSAQLAQSFRFRLTKVAKELERHWDAMTKKWPQPTLGLPGGVESVDGLIRFGSHDWAVRCTLWHIAGATPDAERQWGGIAVAESHGHGFDLLKSFAAEAVLVLVDHREAKIWVNSASSEGLIAFHGVSIYPASPAP